MALYDEFDEMLKREWMCLKQVSCKKEYLSKSIGI